LTPEPDEVYRRDIRTSQSFRRRASDGFLSPFSQRKERSMFTRIVELTTKPGKNEQLSATINDKVLPILKRQKGFVDEMVFVSDKEEDRVLALSFWNTKQDAEQYHRTDFPKVQEAIRPLLDAEPAIRTYEVHTSTTHKIAAGRAA